MRKIWMLVSRCGHKEWNNWKWRSVILCCLMGCVILTGGMGNLWVSAASQGETAGLVIDNENIYEGMENSYSGGYVPKVDKKQAVIVLPLLARRKLSQNRMTVTLRFGETEHLPFVQKNYEKAVAYGYHKTGERISGCYLVTFNLELKEERYNGSYPVTLSVNAEDEAGNDINQDFTVYVMITDGKEAEGEEKQGTSDAGSTAGFVIDNKNVYEGMEKSYSKGYVPKIEAKQVIIVLPLLAKQKLYRNRMTVSLKLGESESLPFVRKNYEKVIAYGYHKTGKRGDQAGGYLVTFRLKLKKRYTNGSYPVVLSVAAQDQGGNEIKQDFTVYVTITDGKTTDGTVAAGGDKNSRMPKFAPKVIVDSCRFSRDKVLCGKESTAKLTLLNTSSTDGVKNMLVTIVPDENIELLGTTSNSYVESLGARRTCNISFPFRVNATAPSGQYSVGITMDYADSKGNAYTVEGKVMVSAGQQTQIEFAPVSIPKKIQMGETVELQAQAMNLGKGKLYNVRAMVEVDGLASSGSAFIGDMEAGSTMTGSLELTAEGLSGDSLYGTTEGKVVFYYEDERGNEMTQEQLFETSILSPLTAAGEERQEDDTRQWWIIMAVIVIFLVQAAVLFYMRRRGLRLIGEEEKEDESEN